MVQFMQIFAEFGAIKDQASDGAEAQSKVKKLQDFITANFYTCTNAILYSLGTMYAGGGDFTCSIDKAGGTGTAEFVCRAIKIYCNK